MASVDHTEHGQQLSPEAVLIAVSETPHSAAVSGDGSHLYVSHFLSGSVSVIDASTYTVTATIGDLLPGTYGVAASVDGRFLYVANPHSQFVKRIATDGSSGAEEINAGVGASCYGLGMSPRGDVLYATCALDDKIILLDNLVKIIGEIDGISFPVGVAASPDGDRLYATNYFSQSVSVIDIRHTGPPETTAGSVVAKIDVPLGPYGIAVSPDGSLIYVAHFHSDDMVSVIDATSLEVVNTLAVGSGLVRGVAVSPDSSELYVTNYFSSSVSVIRLK